MAEGNKLEPKSKPDMVRFCASCGTEFNESASANDWHTCGECETEFKVSVK